MIISIVPVVSIYQKLGLFQIRISKNVRFWLRPQPVDATHARSIKGNVYHYYSQNLNVAPQCSLGALRFSTHFILQILRGRKLEWVVPEDWIPDLVRDDGEKIQG